MKRAFPLVLLLACGPSHPATHAPTPPADAAPAHVPDAAPAAAKDPAPPALRLPTGVAPTKGTLHLYLDPDQDTFTGDGGFEIDVATAQDALWLNATGLDITLAQLGDQKLTPLTTDDDDFVGFRAARPIAPGHYTVTFHWTGKVGSDMSGLFREQEDNRWYEYTQGEAIGARKYMPCFDEPSFKIPWSVTLTVPAGDKAYSNAPVVSDTALEGGKSHQIVFDDTEAIPSYLVAVATGPFEEVDAGASGRGKIATRVIVPAGHTAEAKTTAAQLPKIIGALEDYFDMPLPFPKMDAIAVPHFFGAMENPGLVTFDAGILLASGANDDVQFRQRMTSIVAHEFAHHWFGDYVTLAWWDDLWLNESFATWMADKITAQLEPTWDHVAKERDAIDKAMYFDGRLTAQPLHREITQMSDIEGTFDAISYEKGGAVLGMFEHRIGADKFQAGVRAYMKAHARGNATADDFVGALVGASTPDVGTAFHAYLDTAGVPLVSLTLKGNTVGATVTRLVGFGEKAPAGDAYPVHLCVDYRAGKTQHACADIQGSGEITLAAAPTWLVANADGSQYYRASYDKDLATDLRKHLKDVPAVGRMVVAADQAALLDSGDVSVADTLSLVTPLLATKDVHDLASAVSLIGATLPLVDDAALPGWRAWVVKQLGAAAAKAPLSPPKAESPAQHDARVDLLHLVGVIARDGKLEARAAKALAPWLAGKGDLPHDPDVILAAAARGGDAKLFDALLAKARAAQGQDRADLLTALGYFTDPALITKADDLVTTGEFDILQIGGVFQAQLQDTDGAKVVAQFLRDHWDAIAGKLPKLALPYLVYMQEPSACDADGRAALADFMQTHVSAIPNGAKAVADALGQADQCIARRAAVAGDLAAIIGTGRSAKATSSPAR